ncbi:MAG TPA: aryl-sulfate sulfotransferase [Bacteroidota bacterium]|nr:aryl-sulfate sulfotransferase [Bacteroidota bacterium]
MKIDSLDAPAPGSLFLTTTNALAGLGFYAMVLDNAGNPAAYRKTAPFSNNDFKVQPNGLLSYASVTGVAGAVGIAKTVEMVLDSTLAVVDSFRCGNGYTADFHEFLLLPNGHAYMMAYDPQVVDMSVVVPGGKPNAVVYGSIIQELDAAKNVVFQWRSWDYIPITDCYDDLTASTFDYIHVNSIEVDTDGNLLVSCRETAEILKIDHVTGDIVWRWGGKHNQFTFIGDNAANAPNYFSYQHDVRRIPGGHITLMDNGNQHKPPYSRGAEYALDETGMTATLVWEYRHVPDVFDPAAGSVQRLPNGNTLIGWGTANFLGVGDVAVTEVRPDKSMAYEMSMPKGLFSYRAFRYPWKSGLPSASVDMYDLHPGANYAFNGSGGNTGVTIMLSSGDAMYSHVVVTRYPFAPAAPGFGPNAPALAPARAVIAQAGFVSFNADVTFDSTFSSLVPTPGQATVYYRGTEGSGAFAPMATTYDGVKRTLSVSTSQFGEFALGWRSGGALLTSPALVAPPSGAWVNELGPVKLSWSPRGRALRFNIQIAADSTFGHTAVNDSTVSPSYVLANPVHDTLYFWRTQAVGDSGVSAWSPPWRFRTRAPFISVTYPAGGEMLFRDTAYVIRWQTNLTGQAHLALLGGSGTVLTIADSAQNTGAFLWTIPAGLAAGDGYRLSVTSLTDTTIRSASAGSFSIGSAVLSVSAGSGTPQAFALEQNFPNPFNPSTEIRYALPRRAQVSLEVFNTLGQQVSTLVNGTEESGFHEVRFDGSNFASGVYYYRLRAHPEGGPQGGSGAEAGDFIVTKKLLILK